MLHYIAPHVDIFFNQVQSREATCVYIQTCLKKFEAQITEVREIKIDSLGEPEASTSKRSGADNNSRIIMKEYCDVLLSQIKDRFDFTRHLSAASLFSPAFINTYKEHFPEDSFKSTVEAYPFIDAEKLRTELTVVYSRDDLRCDGALPLLAFIVKNNVQEELSETCKLLDILCTTPMTSCECERCFSTLKRIKCFLRNTMGQDRLNALAILSIEKKLVQTTDNFDDKVINIFANSKNRL